jgi:hypothetical protein
MATKQNKTNEQTNEQTNKRTSKQTTISILSDFNLHLVYLGYCFVAAIKLTAGFGDRS